ncbi:MAG: DUF642 domain-containing protein [Proteobacteria bacterium]|nr:DUF642 domain-containing protein [Pseudomonadota bacterium]
MKKIIFVGALLLILISTGVQAANLIQNGSFENYNVLAWSYSNVDWWQDPLVAKDGSWCIDVNKDTPGWIQQSFATDTNAKYRVDFWLAGNYMGPPEIKHLAVSAGDVSIQYTFDVTDKSQDNMGWTEKSFIFTASSSTTTLRFESMDYLSFGPAIDLVSVEAVPVPPTLMLLAPGLLGLIGIRRRFAK